MTLEEIQKLKPLFVCFMQAHDPQRVYIGLPDVTEEMLEGREFLEINERGYPVFDVQERKRANEILDLIRARKRSGKLRQIIEESENERGDFFEGLETGLERGREAVRTLLNLYDDRHIP